MSIEAPKPMASLGAALLGRRVSGPKPAKRVPLSFAPIEQIAADTTLQAELPEVVLQVARLAHALGIDAPGELVDSHDAVGAPARQRVAFTLRLDAARHRQLREMATTQRRSAQQVLVEAFDRYCAGAPGSADNPATLPSPRKAPTGNQP
jgi:hypothetical protein